jgi:hypothetical protein
MSSALPWKKTTAGALGGRSERGQVPCLDAGRLGGRADVDPHLLDAPGMTLAAGAIMKRGKMKRSWIMYTAPHQTA